MKEYENILRINLLDACQASYTPNISKARDIILELPREWVLGNIHHIATEILNLSDEWEYRRLLELYQMLDTELLTKLITIGLKSNNPEIKEAAYDFIEET